MAMHGQRKLHFRPRNAVVNDCGGEIMLTPRHLFLQLEPSWLVNGQTTSLLASEAWKELVREDLGGMTCRGRRSETRGGLGASSGITAQQGSVQHV